MVQDFYNYNMFSQKIFPEAQFRWFLDIVSYLQFVTYKSINVDTSQSSYIHEAIIRRTTEQSSIIASF